MTCVGADASALFQFSLGSLMLSFRGALEALQGVFDAGSDCLRAKSFEKPTPPAWWEDEVSGILDAAADRIDGGTGDVWYLLQSQRKESVYAELVSFGIDLFDLEHEPQDAAQSLSSEVDGLTYRGGPFWVKTFGFDIGPRGIPFPLYEVPPDDLDRRRDDCGGTDCQAHIITTSMSDSLHCVTAELRLRISLSAA